MNVCFYTCFVSFWYRALETSNRFVFYLPPKLNPQTNRFVTAKHAPRPTAPFCGAHCPVERVLFLRPFDGRRDERVTNAHGLRDRRTTWFWVRAHTTPHKSYPGLLLGFDSRLVDEFGHTR